MDVIPTIRAGAESAPPPSYRAYLNSPHWRMVRNDALKRASYRCNRCQSKRDLQVHHRTYQRLGAELPGDLEVLCFQCHNGHHQDDADRDLGLLLKVVSTVLNRDPFARIPDLAEDVKRFCAEKKIVYRPELLHKAVSLACGTRLKDKDDKPYVSVVDCSEIEISHAQSVEFLTRLKTATGIDFGQCVHTMPGDLVGHGADHADIVREQANDVHRLQAPSRRRSMRDRLEAIFAGRE